MHDNLGLAKKNAIESIKLGVNWIDSTIFGMGRGAGNLKTEDIYKEIYPKDINAYKNIKNIFIIAAFEPPKDNNKPRSEYFLSI